MKPPIAGKKKMRKTDRLLMTGSPKDTDDAMLLLLPCCDGEESKS